MKSQIWVAVIAGCPAILAAIGTIRAASLRQISKQIARIEDKLDRHIEWHLES